MALTVLSGTISAPAANGGTVVISGLTDPKLLILQCLGGTTEGNVNAIKSVGCATKDAGAIQQFYSSILSNDAAATSVTTAGFETTRCLKVHSSVPATICEAHVAAAGDWTTSQITLTFPTTLSGLTIQYLVLGGTELTAFASGLTLTGAVATQDVSLAASWGRPDAVLFFPTGKTADGVSTAAVNTSWGIGFANQAGSAGGIALGEQGGANSMTLVGVGGSRAIYVTSAGSALSGSGSLDTTVTNWPADGFRIAYNDTLAGGVRCGYVALKGIQMECGLTTARTATGTTSLPCGFAPKAVFWAHAGSAGAADALDSTGTLLGQWASGWKKLITTTDARANYAGTDDGQGTSFAWANTGASGDLETRAQPTVATNGSSLDGFATLSANVDNVDMAWATDAASLAVNIPWIAFGDPLVSGNTFTKAGNGQAAFTALGPDVSTFSETGISVKTSFAAGGDSVITANRGEIAISPFSGSGADVATRTETGAGISPFTVLGAKIRERTKTGIAISNNFIASGADTFTPTETGTGISPLSASGADVSQYSESGAGISPLTVLGSNANIFSETGAGASPFVASGPDTATSSETGAGISARVASAADVFTASEAGSGISPFTALGADSAIRAETGISIAAFVASGGSEFIYSESGKGISPFVASGAKLRELPRTGSGIAVFTGSGADTFIAAETGAGIAVFSGSGIKVIQGQPIIYTKSGLAIMPLTAQGADAAVFSELGTAFSIFTGSGADQDISSKTGAGVSVFTGSGLSQVARTAIKTGLGISPRVAFGADVFNATRTGAGIVVLTGGGIVNFVSGGIPALIFPLAVDIAPHISQANIDLITYTVNVNDTLATVAGVEDISAKSANLTDVVYLVEVSEGNYVAVLIDQTTLANLEWTTE